MFTPVILILSALRHSSEEKFSIVKIKFGHGIVFLILLNLVFIISGILLFLFSITIPFAFKTIQYNFIFFLFVFLSTSIFIITGLTFVIYSIYFFRHLYFEATRNIYYDRENRKIIVKKYNSEISIDLDSETVSVHSYYSKRFGRFSTDNCIELSDGNKKIKISDILDITPDLEENITKIYNSTTSFKHLVWI